MQKIKKAKLTNRIKMTKIKIKVQIRCNCKTIMIKRREVEKINLQVSPKDKPEAQ